MKPSQMESVHPKTRQHKFLAIQVVFLIFYEFLKIVSSVNLEKNRKIVTYV